MELDLPGGGSAPLVVRTDVRSNRWFPNAVASIAAGPRYAAHVDYLRVVNGIVFVADSLPERAEANLERIEMLEQDLPVLGRDLARIPVVFQCNKQDRPTAIPIAEMQQRLRWPCCAYVASVATRGEGILEALAALVSLMRSLEKSDPSATPG